MLGPLDPVTRAAHESAAKRKVAAVGEIDLVPGLWRCSDFTVEPISKLQRAAAILGDLLRENLRQRQRQ